MSPRPTLRGKAMKTTGFRIDAELLEEIDRFAAELSERTGVEVQRAAAVRLLLKAGLRSKGKARKGR